MATPAPILERRISEKDDLKINDPVIQVATFAGTEADDYVKPKADYSGFVQKTDPEEIKLVRKLDKYILLSTWSMYWLNYLDRNAIALARLSSLERDLNLTDTQYQTCVSVLFAGYVIVGVFSSMLLTRVKPAPFLVATMMFWAVLSISTAFARNFAHLAITRFFLGVFEAPY